MKSDEISGFTITRLQSMEEAEACAWLMAASEPWITLRRGYEASLKLVWNPTREVYVARVGADVVGFVAILMQESFTGYIQSLAVMPEWRDQGIGSQLLAFAEARIFRESPNVFICVSSFNPDARRLYLRLGYQVVGELPDYVVSGHSEFLLRKSTGPMAGFKRQVPVIRLEHAAVWTEDLERLRAFYETYFGARAGGRYDNTASGFSSYFLTFASGAHLELMSLPGLEGAVDSDAAPRPGYAHLAFSLGSETAVDALTARLQEDGYRVVSGPRRTGDGYYESCVLDPDGNRVELTA